MASYAQACTFTHSLITYVQHACITQRVKGAWEYGEPSLVVNTLELLLTWMKDVKKDSVLLSVEAQSQLQASAHNTTQLASAASAYASVSGAASSLSSSLCPSVLVPAQAAAAAGTVDGQRGTEASAVSVSLSRGGPYAPLRTRHVVGVDVSTYHGTYQLLSIWRSFLVHTQRLLSHQLDGLNISGGNGGDNGGDAHNAYNSISDRGDGGLGYGAGDGNGSGTSGNGSVAVYDNVKATVMDIDRLYKTFASQLTAIVEGNVMCCLSGCTFV